MTSVILCFHIIFSFSQEQSWLRFSGAMKIRSRYWKIISILLDKLDHCLNSPSLISYFKKILIDTPKKPVSLGFHELLRFQVLDSLLEEWNITFYFSVFLCLILQKLKMSAVIGSCNVSLSKKTISVFKMTANSLRL